VVQHNTKRVDIAAVVALLARAQFRRGIIGQSWHSVRRKLLHRQVQHMRDRIIGQYHIRWANIKRKAPQVINVALDPDHNIGCGDSSMHRVLLLLICKRQATAHLVQDMRNDGQGQQQSLCRQFVYHLAQGRACDKLHCLEHDITGGVCLVHPFNIQMLQNNGTAHSTGKGIDDIRIVGQGREKPLEGHLALEVRLVGTIDFGLAAASRTFL
jgi:hypothetical protein